MTQRSRIADDLLKTIRAGRFPIGSKLPSERRLAEQYGVSRPVIREALGMLSTLDVVDIQLGRGAFVINTDVELEREQKFGLIDVVDAREVIESGALRLADVRADDNAKNQVAAAFRALEEAVAAKIDTTELDLALHHSIVEAARSPMLLKLWADMTEEITHTVRISPHGRSMNAEILEGHRKLAAGISEGELEAALHACSALYDGHRDFLRSLLG